MDWDLISQAIDKSQKLFPTMDLETEKGSSVIFSYPDHGMTSDIERAEKYLNEGNVYTVESVTVGNSRSYVELKEIPGISFNTVQFSYENEEEK